MDINLSFLEYILSEINNVYDQNSKKTIRLLDYSPLVHSITDDLMERKEHKMLAIVFEMFGSLEQSFFRIENLSKKQKSTYADMAPYWTFVFINISSMYYCLNGNKQYGLNLARNNYFNQLENLDYLSKKEYINSKVANYCKNLYRPYYTELLGDTCLLFDYNMAKDYYEKAKLLFVEVDEDEQAGMANDYHFSGATYILYKHLSYCNFIKAFFDDFNGISA
ncbi:hypothetical protein EDC18_10189 [Natranaerovirga pectinivora]|uniref:Uncharacterized protein n=1 Tax=Natranaerovirga pectinivora TaxID=682400 RepID=A0A4R3MQJ2_9FIRM|nr:hypothetical protein [Natranaerovirga pectinivora]TCT16793.1 hypothetical protein EDC18_10189 [Natranaerovirga pectinivora]